MAFSGGGGFSFGSNNNTNNNQGGFGSTFGANTNTGFGASTTGNNPFGGTSGGFGSSNNNAFGSSTTGNSIFGNKTTSAPFGSTTATTGGSLFGNNNSNNTATGGFGSSNFSGTTLNSGFGGTNNAGGTSFSFGSTANKPAFGAAATSTPLFGQGGAGTTTGFGAANTGFGGSAGTALNQPVPPSEGTASTPFAPTADKEANGTNNSYQSIVFQQPYQKYSFEELRMADYNAGRQFGNNSGQAGAFGTSSFGGFGSSNTAGGFGGTGTGNNPFGSNNATAGTFGSTTGATGFGNNAGTGLFSNTQNKPATGLFGAQNTTPGTTTGLFGATNNNAGGFGSGTTGAFGSNTNAGTGLFGNNQNKPATGLFGNNAQSTPSLFGNNNNNNQQTAGTTGTGLFGNSNANTTGGLFSNNQQSNTGGLFGGNNNQQSKPSLFSGFGTATTQNQTSGGLFGTVNSTTNNAGNGLFGNNNTTNTGGGLFGSNTNNNTNTGGGLFGNTTQNNNAGGGLFGANTQNQSKPGGLFGTPSTGGGLFGNANNATNTTGGLFGSTSANTGGGLFNTNKSTPSLFGNTSANQGTGFGTGGFGASGTMQQQGQQQQETVKHASLLDPNPYGQSSIWTGLPAASPENSKPVFTPLTASQKLKESMMKPPPTLRLNQSRYMTPPRRNGYGFTYSTYGTPNSAASTPGGGGLSGSMYGSRGWSGGSFGRSFNKSASVQNLRAQFSSDSDELWKPGAFTSSGRHSSGSIKRLTIDRSIRNDLFSRPTQAALPAPPAEKSPNNTSAASNGEVNGDGASDPSGKMKKRVSFDNSTTGGQLNGQTGALVRAESPEEDDEGQSPPTVNGDTSVRGNELAVVPEDRESNHVSAPSSDAPARADPQPGDYWMKPSRAEMAKMPRERLQKFKDFQVGRHGCGQVTFNGTVDLTAIPLDDLYDKIVEIRLRSVTVYPEASSKPPVGKGLNVPSTIAIENSWPRSRNQPSSATSGPVFDKHVNRLKKMTGTEFVDYEIDTGVWTFRVPHYTRYGLDYEDEDADMSDFTPPPNSITKSASDDSTMDVQQDNSIHSEDEDDTFAFKQSRTVPGGFGRQPILDYDFEPTTSALVPTDQDMQDDNLSVRSASLSEDDVSDDEPSMAGAFPASAALDLNSPAKPILKAHETPDKPLLDLDGDWADQLQQTISPRKQNRDILRGTQNKVLLDRTFSPIKPKSVQNGFRTSVDVMSSIFGKYEESRMSTNSRGSSGRESKAFDDFELPNAKRTKTLDNSLDALSAEDRTWFTTLKAKFSQIGALAYSTSTESGRADGHHETPAGADNDLSFNLKALLSSSLIDDRDGVPHVEHRSLPFSHLIEDSNQSSHSDASQQLKSLYQLAHVLFDTYEDRYSLDLPSSADDRAQLVPLIRKDRLTDYLSTYIRSKHGERITRVEKENPTAAAVLKLSTHDIKGACDSLEKAKNYKLMLLVSQLANASQFWQEDIRAQIDAWRDQGVLSEISDDVRAIYEICAGNVTICQGKSAPGVPVEDKAKTFALSEEFGLDWLQSFAMGLWYGIDEKRNADGSSRVLIEDAVREFIGRCDRGEESAKPNDDVQWVLLQVYASLNGATGVTMPVFPQALDSLASKSDVSNAFTMHFAVTSSIVGVEIDDAKADELSALLAWQLSSKDDLSGSIYALLHVSDAEDRIVLVKALLKRFAATLPDPSLADTQSDSALWITLTDHLQIPAAWIFAAKALHARSIDPSGHTELEYLIAARSWTDAHECLIRRVAPGCIVDADYKLLSTFVGMFGDNVESQIPDWYTTGGMYADFVQLVNSKLTAGMDEDLIAGLARRLATMGREFRQGNRNNQIDLGKLPLEKLEERVAVMEMSRVVAEKMGSDTRGILELPITSDLRLRYTLSLAGEHFTEVMESGAVSV